jgi:hypothetical protein
MDGFLPIERQTIGIFGDGDLGQQRLGGDAALDDMVFGAQLWFPWPQQKLRAGQS